MEMTDSQKLDIILSKIEKIDSLENEIKEVRSTLGNEIKEVKSALENEITTLGNEIKEVRSTLGNEIKEVKTTLESEIQELNKEIKKVELILENEIRSNIQRVAEGHLDLSRNLQEIIKYKDEIETLSITTRILVTEVQTLKSKVS